MKERRDKEGRKKSFHLKIKLAGLISCPKQSQMKSEVRMKPGSYAK
jgi:hypothetical protein